jgi:hypothetical protein
VVPDRIPLNRETTFRIAQMPYPVHCYSDDSRVAIVIPNGTHYTIRPKRMGTFKLLVCRAATTTGQVLPNKYPIMSEKEITVVLR